MTSALDVHCPYCAAPVDAFCKTPTGAVRPAHADRKANAVTDQPTYYLAEHQGVAPALFSTREAAQDYCDDVTRMDARGHCWDWMPEKDGVQEQCWVDVDSDRPTCATGGVVTALQLDADA